MGFFNRRNKDHGGHLMSLRQSLVPKNPPDGAPCNYESTIRSGFFIRAFECDTLERKLRKDARRVNMSFIKSAVPTGTFVKEFRQCALQQLTRRGAATSLLRHDLPTRSYRDTFGFMLRTNASQVSCAYAFDSHRTYGTGLRCAKTLGGSIEQHLARRYQVVTQACSRKGHKRTSGVNAQAEDWRVNCCWDNVEDAAEAQRRYVELPHNSMCSIGDGLNQMQLSWEVDDVVGVYYVRRVDEEFAKLIWSLVTDVKKSRAETRLGEGASAALPKLDYCRLPPPKLKLRKAQPGEEQRLAELAASAPPAMGMLSSWLSFLG